jgi:hypothetical protein
MRQILLLSVLTNFWFSSATAQQDTVYYDSKTGNYIIQYMRENEEGMRDSLISLLFEPATKIAPKASAVVSWEKDSNTFVYSYTIANGPHSKQNLLSFFLEFPKGIEPINETANRWFNGRAHFATAGRSEKTEGWDWMGDQGLEPGWSTDGFALASSSLPGMTNAYFRGAVKMLGFPAEPPFEIDRQVARLEVFPTNHVRRATVGPVLLPDQISLSTLLDTLISYTRQSANLGWLGKERDDDCDDDERPDAGIARNIEQRFQKAKRELTKGDSVQARKELEKLVQKVERIWKRSQEDEKKHRKDKWEKRDQVIMTSEAYALLKYNTEYLVDRLPEKSKHGRGDDEKDKKPKK